MAEQASSIVINGIPFTPREDCNYIHDYEAIQKKIDAGELDRLGAYRALVLEDLWFVLYFVLGVVTANHPFVVQACRDVQEGPESGTVDLWARDHFKSTAITQAQTIRKIARSKILKNLDERICIFSHTRAIALSFLRLIKQVLEGSELLRACFPDVFWADPVQQAPKWSEDGGLFCIRKGYYKEATLEAWGLVDGMPTSKHFTGRVYDDIETKEAVYNADNIKKLIDAFDLSHNLGIQEENEGVDEWFRVIGTPYSHLGLLAQLMKATDDRGEPLYHVRRKPATENGLANGRPLMLSQKKLDRLKRNPYLFRCQQLINPTPEGTEDLDPECLIQLPRAQMPKRLFKFMMVDPAGTRKDRRGDAWALLVIGVEPYRDDIGASNIYILDAVVREMPHAEALDIAVKMFMRNGRVLKLAVEKVALSTTEIHISNALRAKGKYVTLKRGNLVVVGPQGRGKVERITGHLQWPLLHGKIHVNEDIPLEYRERLRAEMKQFPYWHDDTLDALAYLYDVIGVYKFGVRPPPEPDEEDEEEDLYDRIREPKDNGDSWMSV